jgi:hypothetical protein
LQLSATARHIRGEGSDFLLIESNRSRELIKCIMSELAGSKTLRKTEASRSSMM